MIQVSTIENNAPSLLVSCQLKCGCELSKSFIALQKILFPRHAFPLISAKWFGLHSCDCVM